MDSICSVCTQKLNTLNSNMSIKITKPKATENKILNKLLLFLYKYSL